MSGIFRDFLGRKRQHGILRMGFNAIINGGKHLQCITGRCVRLHFGRCIQSEKGSVDSPAPKLGEIDVSIAVVFPEIPQPQKLGRGVHMAVEDHYFVP